MHIDNHLGSNLTQRDKFVLLLLRCFVFLFWNIFFILFETFLFIRTFWNELNLLISVFIMHIGEVRAINSCDKNLLVNVSKVMQLTNNLLEWKTVTNTSEDNNCDNLVSLLFTSTRLVIIITFMAHKKSIDVLLTEADGPPRPLFYVICHSCTVLIRFVIHVKNFCSYIVRKHVTIKSTFSSCKSSSNNDTVYYQYFLKEKAYFRFLTQTSSRLRI